MSKTTWHTLNNLETPKLVERLIVCAKQSVMATMRPTEYDVGVVQAELNAARDILLARNSDLLTACKGLVQIAEHARNRNTFWHDERQKHRNGRLNDDANNFANAQNEDIRAEIDAAIAAIAKAETP
jgi:hypothetical protein